jgi:peptidoglycan hydrolase CwlO-like protein
MEPNADAAYISREDVLRERLERQFGNKVKVDSAVKIIENASLSEINSLKGEIHNMKSDIAEMKRDIKELLECMKAVYEFEDAPPPPPNPFD